MSMSASCICYFVSPWHSIKKKIFKYPVIIQVLRSKGEAGADVVPYNVGILQKDVPFFESSIQYRTNLHGSRPNKVSACLDRNIQVGGVGGVRGPHPNVCGCDLAPQWLKLYNLHLQNIFDGLDKEKKKKKKQQKVPYCLSLEAASFLYLFVVNLLYIFFDLN